VAAVVEDDRLVDPGRVRNARTAVPDPAAACVIVGRLALVADVTRLRLLLALREVDELCVGDLGAVLNASPDAVGYALRILRSAGLVTFRKEGRTVFYRLADSFPTSLLDACALQGTAGLPTRGWGAKR